MLKIIFILVIIIYFLRKNKRFIENYCNKYKKRVREEKDKVSKLKTEIDNYYDILQNNKVEYDDANSRQDQLKSNYIYNLKRHGEIYDEIYNIERDITTLKKNTTNTLMKEKKLSEIEKILDVPPLYFIPKYN